MAKQCDFCDGVTNDNWVIRISDEKGYREFNGHKTCVDEISEKHNAIKDVKKKSLEYVLNKLGLE